MQRHGVVIPLDGPPNTDCGGPSSCAICNAEMIEVEELALEMAAHNFAGDGVEASTIERRWIAGGPWVRYWRAAARLSIQRTEWEKLGIEIDPAAAALWEAARRQVKRQDESRRLAKKRSYQSMELAFRMQLAGRERFKSFDDVSQPMLLAAE